ncbi:MAG TPA: hypothetical protein V6C97_21935 [Oculatellaceae cyanobacterium]
MCESVCVWVRERERGREREGEEGGGLWMEERGQAGREKGTERECVHVSECRDREGEEGGGLKTEERGKVGRGKGLC